MADNHTKRQRFKSLAFNRAGEAVKHIHQIESMIHNPAFEADTETAEQIINELQTAIGRLKAKTKAQREHQFRLDL